MNSYQQLPPQERMVIMAKIYHHIWYSEGRYFDMLNMLDFSVRKKTNLATSNSLFTKKLKTIYHFETDRTN
jgi:hypothetical protein